MTGENPKKLKTNVESESDGTVTITSISTNPAKTENPGKTDKNSAIPGALISEDLFFIEQQGKSSVNYKLNSVLKVGDQIVLLKNFPDADLYKGYLCAIIGVCGDGDDDTYYEIEFFSFFRDNDDSRKSQKRNLDFEFPTTSYTTYVKSQDFIRLVDQDLYYKTCFS